MKKINEEVYVPEDDTLITLNKTDIDTIQQSAAKSLKLRSRVCIHNNSEDSIQEMIIVHNKRVYVKPHKHTAGSESFHIIKGKLEIILFNENGDITNIIPLEAYHQGKNPSFCYRLNKPLYHTIIVKSRFVVIHEVINGPFKKENSEFPSWAPSEEEKEAVNKWKIELEWKVKDFKMLTSQIKKRVEEMTK